MVLPFIVFVRYLFHLYQYLTHPPSFVEISTLGCGIHVLIGMHAFAIDMGYPAGQDFEPRNVNEKIVYNLLIDNRASLWSRLSNLT